MLADAIENLYSVFARFRPSTLNKSCPCCVDAVDVDLLRSKPLHTLSVDDLSYYSWKAVTTIGTVDDYKYFLPRLCELAATVPLPKNVEIVLAGNLVSADFADWPQDERAAVEQYLHALWNDLLHTWPYHLEADSALCCLALILGSHADALATWSTLLPSVKSARLHLAGWLTYGPGSNDKPPPFWEEAPEAWKAVVTWLRSRTVASVMEAAFADWAQTPEGAQAKS